MLLYKFVLFLVLANMGKGSIVVQRIEKIPTEFTEVKVNPLPSSVRPELVNVPDKVETVNLYSDKVKFPEVVPVKDVSEKIENVQIIETAEKVDLILQSVSPENVKVPSKIEIVNELTEKVIVPEIVVVLEKVVSEKVDGVSIVLTSEKVDLPLVIVSPDIVKVPSKVETINKVTEHVKVPEIHVVPETVDNLEKTEVEEKLDIPAKVQDSIQLTNVTDDDEGKTHSSHYNRPSGYNTQNVVYVAETHRAPAPNVVYVAETHKAPAPQVVYVAETHKAPAPQVVYVERPHTHHETVPIYDKCSICRTSACHGIQ